MDNEIRLQRLEDSSLEMERVKADHEGLTRRLYGNGQPGDIQQIQTKLDELRGAYFKSLGAIAVVMVIVEHFWK